MNKLCAVEFKESNYHIYIVIQVQYVNFSNCTVVEILGSHNCISLWFHMYPLFCFLRVANRVPQYHNPDLKFRTIT